MMKPCVVRVIVWAAAAAAAAAAAGVRDGDAAVRAGCRSAASQRLRLPAESLYGRTVPRLSSRLTRMNPRVH